MIDIEEFRDASYNDQWWLILMASSEPFFREVPLEWIVAFLDTRLSCRFSLRQPREFLSALACLTVDGEPEACRDLYVVAAEDAFVDVCELEVPDHWTGAAPEVEVSPHKLTPRVAALLEDLAGSRQRYTPAALLKLPPLLA